MTVILIGAAIAALAAAFVLAPLLRAGRVEPSEADHAVSIYRDQLDELDRDRAAGLIAGTEREAAEREIARRAARAAKALDGSVAVSRRAPVTAIALGVATILGAVAIYAQLGSPSLPDMPLAARLKAENERQLAARQPAAVAQGVLAELEEMDESFEKHWASAQAHQATGDFASAAEAYRKAAEARGGDPAVEAAYAEALTLANGNKVPKAAKLVFAQVLSRQPNEPRARYYLALAKAQEQDFSGALAEWVALYDDSPAEAPWRQMVRRDIVNMARFTKADLATILPDASASELARASGAEGVSPEARIAEIEATDPAERSHELWLELIALKAAGDKAAALEVVSAARARYAAAPFVLQLIDEAAAEAGLVADRRGPDASAVAAVSKLPQDQQKDLIANMVASLAERLDASPVDPEGWAMLIRSYAVLDKPDEAREALAAALETFKEEPAVAERLRKTAAEFSILTN